MRKNMLWILSSIVLSGSVLCLSVLGAQENRSIPIYDQVLEKLESLRPGGTIEVSMGTEKEQYEIGDPFEIRFRASQECYVVLLDIGSSQKDAPGAITFLFPNRYFPDNKITGGKVYSTLYDFNIKATVGLPYGVETINIFCSPEKIDLFGADFKEAGYYTIKPDDEAGLQALLDRLNQLEQREWSGSSAKIFIGKPLPPRALPKKYGALPPIGSTGSTGKFWPPIGSTGTTGKQ